MTRGDLLERIRRFVRHQPTKVVAAKKIGVHVSTLNNWLDGKHFPAKGNLKRLGAAINGNGSTEAALQPAPSPDNDDEGVVVACPHCRGCGCVRLSWAQLQEAARVHP